MDLNELLSEVCSPFFYFFNCHVSSDYQYVERKENPWFNEIWQEKRHIILHKHYFYEGKIKNLNHVWQ